MKNFLTAILIFTGVVYLSSCSNRDSTTTNALIVPPQDSISAGSIVTLYFNNDTFVTTDLAVKTIPIEAISASNVYNPSDSTWITTVVLTDYTRTKTSLNLTAYRDSSSPVGIYYFTTNTSTLTDFSTGANRPYSVMDGTFGGYYRSSLTITNASYPISGTLSLMLHYNSDTINATGTFMIY